MERAKICGGFDSPNRGERERKAVRSRRKKKGKGDVSLTGGTDLSATQMRRKAARDDGSAGRGWARPMREKAGAGVSGPR
jgi:hypothetical protein